MMSPPARRFGLVAHVVSSVGWLGAVVMSFALGIIGLVSTDARLVQGAYVTTEAVGWTVLVPLSLLSLVTGLIQSLGTRWGLVRHYWVLIKLAMNLLASIVLLLYMQTLGVLAENAKAWTGGSPDAMRSPSPALHAGAAIVLLLVAAVLSIYKPAGRTGYGQRRVGGAAAVAQDDASGLFDDGREAQRRWKKPAV
jgi:hypothetical protein